uniref:Neutral and basic amino acid transport protein rBAT-like isoform X4 n=2 Tax=Crassostrea virginica TaxID=6565 RepID=A0A8B8DUA4_CRAVI|nr:neutral and basic amino acid transport protein rBAT-like isoform X4 [Crassostrea virginica]
MSGSYNIEPLAYKLNDNYSSEKNNDDIRSPEGIDVKVPESNGTPFRGMGKEELLQHSSKPFWRRLRMICISIILLGWLALIITVVALVLIYPKCKSPDSRSWWQNEIIYRVYVRSYKDSNGDGVGDLDGVTSKLDYIKDLGVGVISLSPTFEDDGNDGDFHIKNHMKIDDVQGGDDALQRLITQAHGKGLKIILDFVPSHTSDQSEWFQWSEAAKFRNDSYRNFYVWTETPTNWKSVYGGDAWNTSDVRTGESYLHQFLHNQPDLNLRSPQVKDELNDILVFWLNKSVDGFYIRNSAYLFEDYDLRDEPKLQNAAGDEYSDYNHIYTKNLPEIYDMFARWRTTADGFMNRVLMADPDPSSSEKEMMKYYGHFQRDGVQLPIRRRDLAPDCGGQCIKDYVNGWMDNLPAGRWPTWSLGDEMTPRLATNHSESFIRCFSMLTMLLPGTPVLYYGDEINMVDLSMSTSETSRKQPMRGLMQWDDTPNGGFTNFSTPWIGIGADHQTNNVKNQSAKGDSLLSFFKNLTTLRSEDTFRIGDYRPAIVDNSVFSFVREFDGKKGYLVAINFGNTAQTRDYTTAHSTIQSKASFDLTTGGSQSFDSDTDVDTSSLALGPMQGVAVSWDYVAKEL